jgi:hypothetical protein
MATSAWFFSEVGIEVDGIIVEPLLHNYFSKFR